MNRLKLTIEYDGSDYIGWQKQKRKSVQEEIEKSLLQLFQKKFKFLVLVGQTLGFMLRTSCSL